MSFCQYFLADKNDLLKEHAQTVICIYRGNYSGKIGRD